ncbi:hypothetical protein PP707_08100 [Acetobacter pasteurianus]|nr:hypothetical protein [Acetobacter pasteurianus]
MQGETRQAIYRWFGEFRKNMNNKTGIINTNVVIFTIDEIPLISCRYRQKEGQN